MAFLFSVLGKSSLPTTILWALGGLVLPYVAIGCLLLIPAVERRAIYMHDFKTTPRGDLNHPEKFGFARNQVTSFHISTRDGVVLHAWHILPLSVYEDHKDTLGNNAEPRRDASEELLCLLRDDPGARLIIHAHGSSGTLASSWRADSYKALSSMSTPKIHVLAFDYRGFGLSEGVPSEQGLLMDAEAVFDWAIDVAGVSPERIVIFGHSMGSGVAIGLYQRLLLERKIQVAGLVAVSGFVDIATVAKTYTVGGVPVFKPLQIVPGLVEFLTRKLESTWKNGDRLVDIVRKSEKYHIEIVHARDDAISISQNGVDLFRHAQMASNMAAYHEADVCVEPGSTKVANTDKGRITLTLPNEGSHDAVISRPAVMAAIRRAFGSSL
ncbi:Alpha/Beta hydrolase protein [Truncatella angustata]|uniref:Alpha/Beta hydrolase protein n=1 Tax=Truncatella angustata TaxID=152316 RepID=A0A9P8UJF8_9PEZI|nr:Alpha/Beta hydrolase protein [Truncatella angustata]KAH6653150.1 Alpha/Beta hydrolase protein [Truncatella angustata]